MKNPVNYVWFPGILVFAFAICLNEFTEFRLIAFALTIAFAICLSAAIVIWDKLYKAAQKQPQDAKTLEKYAAVNAGASIIVLGDCFMWFTDFSGLISFALTAACAVCVFTAAIIWDKRRKAVQKQHD